MIRPTLFVGLGTTGTNILKSLRELMFEEYGRAGLPIFRYVAIETDENMDESNTNQMRDYERINLVNASIGNFDTINLKLDSNKNLYNPHLDEWLNRDVLKFAKAFKAGAAHIRMAGRLCLWENWGEMQGTLAKAHGAIIAPASIKNANDILDQHYKAKGIPVDNEMIGGDIHIYVVGSLCGGTCSGMMIDMAYHCRNLLDGKEGNEIHGIFTMFDRRAATDDDALTDVRSANCYGSLWELNYYNHMQTTYDVILPNSDGKVASPDKIPFDDTMLVSCSSMDPNNQFVDEQGNLDLDGLNLMVALQLFAETAGNTRGLKDAMGINGLALNGFGTLKEVVKGETTDMMKCMASYGLTAVWYPKYRIASASASLVSQELCENWIASHVPQATTVTEAEKEWNQILKGNIDTLTSPAGQSSIRSRIETHLARAKQLWLNKEISSNQLSQNMEEFPTGDSFKKKFEQGGEYIELMKMQVSECQKVFRNAIEQTLNNQLGSIDFAGTHGLGDVRMFFKTLDEEIEKTIQNCPERMPSLDLRKLDFDPMNSANSSFWLKSLWLRDDSVKSHRNHVIDQYCNLIIGNRTSFYESVRNHLIRSILQEIRTELGFGVIPADEGGPNRPRTIKERLDKIEGNLSNCIKDFKSEYSKAINPPRSECVMIVANNAKNRIDADAATLSQQITQADGGIALLDGTTMTSFLQKDCEDIFDLMTTTYRRMSLSRIRSHDVVQEVQKHLNAGTPNIPNLARRSNPYQKFQSTYQPLLNAPPKIIFGHDPTNNVLPGLAGKLGFSNFGASSVDHLLFFYQEEYGFTIDDLDVYRTIKQQFDKIPTPGTYGHSTHQDADFYNLGLKDKTQKLKRWCQVLARLVPEIGNRIDGKAFEGVFQLDHGKYVYEYVINGSTTWLGLQNHEGGIKELSMKQNESAYHEFFNAVQSRFNRLDRQKINESIIKPLLLEVENLEARNKINSYYNRFLDEVYSKGTIANDTTSSVEAELDTYFSQVSPPAPEETQHHEAEQSPSQQTENISSETATDQTENTDGYEEVTPETEEVRHDIGTANQSISTDSDDYYEESVNSEETDSSSENTLSPEVNEDGIVWRNAEPETEPSSAEEFTAEQQPQPEVVPENVKQKKQKQPSREFSVADVDLKRIQRRGSTRKKE